MKQYEVKYVLKMYGKTHSITETVEAANAKEARAKVTERHEDRYSYYPKIPHMFQISVHVKKEAKQ